MITDYNFSLYSYGTALGSPSCGYFRRTFRIIVLVGPVVIYMPRAFVTLVNVTVAVINTVRSLKRQTIRIHQISL